MKAARIPALLSLTTMLWIGGCGDSTTTPTNQAPRIISVTARPTAVVPLGSTQLNAFVVDVDGDALTLSWTATGGSFSDSSATTTTWTAPDSSGLFVLTLVVSDQMKSVSQSVNVEVGSTGLTVLSEPPGAFITLNGTPTGRRTPHTFNPLSPGTQVVALSNPYFVYSAASQGVTLADGEVDTVRFDIRTPTVSVLNPGRSDLLEIGGIVFLPNGSGFLYQGRTASGSGLFTTSTGNRPGNGTMIRGDVRMEESVTVSSDGAWVFFVSNADSLYALPITDEDGDGVVDSVGTAIALRRNAFGPTMSTTGELAFSFAPSEDPSTNQIFYSTFTGAALPDVRLATTSAGKLPTWKPDEPYIAFVRNGLILSNFVNLAGPSSPDTIAADGYNTAPSWGKWGLKHVAYLHGPDALNLTEVRLGVKETPFAATVSASLEDPRFVAWDPALRRVAVTHHPGGTPEVIVFFDLPIP